MRFVSELITPFDISLYSTLNFSLLPPFMNARELLSIRKQTTSNQFVDDRVRETKEITDRQVIKGTVVGRNPATGEYRVDTGNGRYRWAKSVASSDIVGKSVAVTIAGKVGQIAEMPGFY